MAACNGRFKSIADGFIRANPQIAKSDRIMSLEFRHLQTFSKAAELQSFTKAARELDLTQAAVSQHVAALEKQLGVALFDRVGRTVVLSAAGHKFYGHACRILDLVEQACLDVGNTETKIAGRLRVASSTVPAETLLPELLAGFRQLHADVQESVTVSDSRAAAQAVENGDADLGMVGELPQATSLQARPIGRDKLVLVVSPDHPLADVKKVSLKRLRAESLIVRVAGSASRHCVDQALQAAGVSPNELTIVMESNSNDAIRAAVECGVGAAFLSRSAIANDLDAGRLVELSVSGVRPERQLYLITDPARLPNAAVRAFLDFVDEWATRPHSSGRRKATDRKRGQRSPAKSVTVQ